MEILHYLTPQGIDLFDGWLDTIPKAAAARIAMRIDRLEAGSFGDCRPVGQGVWELRIDHGPGYRVYYALAGQQVVLLLCGGDKRRQTSDIRRAIEMWADYNRRKQQP